MASLWAPRLRQLTVSSAASQVRTVRPVSGTVSAGAGGAQSLSWPPGALMQRRRNASPGERARSRFVLVTRARANTRSHGILRSLVTAGSEDHEASSGATLAVDGGLTAV